MSAFHKRADGAECLQVHRVDRGRLKSPKKTDHGFLRVDAHLTRTGVFVYRNADGTERREYRPPSEVFDAEAMASFALVPLTDEHPPSYLTPKTAKQYTRGSLGTPRRDGEYVAGELLVTDADLIAKMESGEKRQVSLGYRCDLEMTSGETPEGERFDAIQRDIRGNHCAIVQVGRAGPGAAVRMDASNLAVLLDQESGGTDPAPSSTQRDDEATVKHTIRIGGVPFEVESAQTAAAFEKYDADNKAALEKANEALKVQRADADKVQGKLDAEVEAHGKTKKELEAAPEKFRADALERVQLETKARQVLGDKVKLDGLKPSELREKVLAKLSPDLDLAGKSEAYAEARFDAAFEAFTKKKKGAEADEDEEEEDPKKKKANASGKLRADAEDVEDDNDDEEPAEKADAQSAYDAMVARNQNAWKRGNKADDEAGAE